uniref:Plectin/S10 N-terminal domain-containing protein n=1 Tax=Ditylenchus dipsaci TaxID=166011 RepID=A0A915DT95_9BILA
MLMPKADRKKIYEHLFEDGVCIAKQDYNLKSHPEIKGVKNLYVIKALKSLVSRGLVKEQFAWRHYYFFLNADATHRVKVEQSKSGMPEKGGRGYGRSESDRAGYRQTDKVAEAGPGAVPVTGHRGGFGRGGGENASQQEEQVPQ